MISKKILFFLAGKWRIRVRCHELSGQTEQWLINYFNFIIFFYISGIIVWLLELYNPSCRSSGPGHGAACARFYRDVISFVPGGCAIGILIILIGMDMHKLGQRSRRRRERTERNERVLEGEEDNEEIAQQPQHEGQDDREREQQRRRIAGEFGGLKCKKNYKMA